MVAATAMHYRCDMDERQGIEIIELLKEIRDLLKPKEKKRGRPKKK